MAVTPFEAGSRHEGQVISYAGSAGWGFVMGHGFFEAGLVDTPDKGVFFHLKDVAGGVAPAKGQTVSFTLSANDAGKPQAIEITPSIEATEDPEGAVRECGTIMSFSGQAKWGFVDCPHRPNATGGAGIFFHLNDFPNCGKIEKGAAVTFLVDDTTNPEKPQARSLRYEDPEVARQAAMNPYADKGAAGKSGKGVGNGIPSKGGKSVGGKGKNGQLSGTILSWNAEKGWGFLTSPASGLPADTGIFCHAKDFVVPADPSELLAGQSVVFTVETDKSGKPHAKGVSLAYASQAWGKAAAPKGGTGKASAAPKGKGSPMSGAGAKGGKFDGKTKMSGTILSYNDQKFFGFVHSTVLDATLGEGQGVFFHKKDLMTQDIPSPGQPVTFCAGYDEKGKPHASQVTLGGAKGKAKTFD